MTNIEKLNKYLKERDIRIGGFTPGTNPNVTPDEIAKEILATLMDLEERAARGELEEELLDI